MIRTTITLPDGLYKDLGHLAVNESKTLKELLIEAVEEYVRRKKRKGGD